MVILELVARPFVILSGVLALTTAALASPPPFEVGGIVGGAATNTSNTGPCPVLRAPAAPATECTSTPHSGEQGVVLGAHVRYRVLSTVSVEAGLTYSQKGYNDGNEVRLHYVEAPLLVRIDPFEAKPARVFLVGGLSPAVMLACRESGQIFMTDHAETYSGSCAPYPYLDKTPDRFDLSGVVGIGVGWELGFGAIEVQARIERGLIDVNGWDSSGKTINQSMYIVAGFDRTL